MSGQPNPAPQTAWSHLLAAVDEQWPVERWRELGVVVGCSGGADSVALVSALAALRAGHKTPQPPPRGFLVVAHFNHRLRGAEADTDEQFCQEIARQSELRWSRGAVGFPKQDEASMRAERLRFLVGTAHEQGARYLALAHSADDNVETVLHHLLRGTGPAGLSGIGSPRTVADDLVLVRPLLEVRRSLIRAALQEQGIPWREDSSNRDPAYRRNWIRHELVPLMEAKYPEAVEAIARAVAGQRQWRGLIDRLALAWLQEHQGDGPVTTLRRDGNLEPAIAIAAAQILWSQRCWPRGEMTQRHWLRLATTMRGGETERYTLPSAVEVAASGGEITLIRATDASSIAKSDPDSTEAPKN